MQGKKFYFILLAVMNRRIYGGKKYRFMTLDSMTPTAKATTTLSPSFKEAESPLVAPQLVRLDNFPLLLL